MNRLKTQNGFTLVKFLIVAASVVVLGAIVIPGMVRWHYATLFQKYFGLDPRQENFSSDTEARVRTQSQVDIKMRKLAILAGESKEEAQRLSKKYSAAASGNKSECLKALRDALAAHETAVEDYRTARRVAVRYEFMVG